MEGRIKGRSETENPEEPWRAPPASRTGDVILPSFPSSKSRNRSNATYGWSGWTNERAIDQGSSSARSRSLSSQLFTGKKWILTKPRHFPVNTLIKSSHRLFSDNRSRVRCVVEKWNDDSQGGERAASSTTSGEKDAAPTFRHLIRNCVLTSKLPTSLFASANSL